MASQENEEFLIRRMQSSDIPILGVLAATAYSDSPLDAFLCPHRHEYPEHVIRRFVQMIQGRYLNPRSIGFVAVHHATPSTPIAYAQFIRLGNDQAALQLISNQRSLWRLLKTWWFKIRTSIVNLLWPDRSVNRDALNEYFESCKHDEQCYWESPEMKIKYLNRWHAQSVVVSSSCQRQGIGRRLMEEVLQRAQNEGVIVGLEASPDGEKLYQKLGFELRGPFSMNIGLPAGGIMMWKPKRS
ncbi:hypothetical protein N7507_011503 [Penicillium longicatenatum]|nr:hypothetical protein N7507_011503 [Penicillium longicatenatum]